MYKGAASSNMGSINGIQVCPISSLTPRPKAACFRDAHPRWRTCIRIVLASTTSFPDGSPLKGELKIPKGEGRESKTSKEPASVCHSAECKPSKTPPTLQSIAQRRIAQARRRPQRRRSGSMLPIQNDMYPG